MTYWGRRADTNGTESSPDFTSKTHQVKEGQICGLSRHRPQLSIPQNETRSFRIPENQIILQSTVHLRTIPIISDNKIKQMREPKTRGQWKHTAMESTGSDGWKLLGPSSHKYPSLSTVVIFPPTRPRASVTRTSPTALECLVISAWAVHSPLIPPPTTTQSTEILPAGSPAPWEGEIVDSLAIEHRIHLRRVIERLRALLNGFREKDAVEIDVAEAAIVARSERAQRATSLTVDKSDPFRRSKIPKTPLHFLNNKEKY